MLGSNLGIQKVRPLLECIIGILSIPSMALHFKILTANV